MTETSSIPADEDVVSADDPLTTLDPSAGYVTIVNTYDVAPERAEELLEFVVRSTVDILRFVPGFVSANLHVSLDRTKIVNYAQWKSREAIAAARSFPGVADVIAESGKIADKFLPVHYELRASVPAAQQEAAPAPSR